MAKNSIYSSNYQMMRKLELTTMMRLTIIFMSIFLVIIILYSSYIKLVPYYMDRMKLENTKLEMEIQGIKVIPNIEEKIAILEKKTVTLTTENIESRLNAIETAISKGNIKPEEIRNLQELNSELDKLKSYLFVNTDDIIEFKTLQRNYQELKNNQGKYMEAEDIKRELSFQQTLLFICISIFGILVTIFATSWIVSRRRDKKQEQVGSNQNEDENKTLNENEE